MPNPEDPRAHTQGMIGKPALPASAPRGYTGCPERPPGEVSSSCPDSAGPGWRSGLGQESGAHATPERLPQRRPEVKPLSSEMSRRAPTMVQRSDYARHRPRHPS